MAFFKFRPARASKSGESARSVGKPKQEPADSVDGLRRRARHRLIGAVVLVLIAVVGFPLLFETEPRPGPVDAPITIPDQDKAPPLALPQAPHGDVPAASSLGAQEEMVPSPMAQGSVKNQATPTPLTSESAPAEAAQAPSAEPPVATPPAAAANKASSDQGSAKAPSPELAKPATKTAERAADAPSEAEAKKAAAERAKRADAARALAALEGRTVPDKVKAAPAPAPAASDSGRFIIQIGAFTDTAAATKIRRKAQDLGLKSYTQAHKTADGKLTTRVRVGPFASRAEAERAAASLKRAGLASQIITL